MTETRTIYTCDICNKTIQPDEMKIVPIPIEEADCEGRSYFPIFRKVDMCKSCSDRYREVVYKNFGICRETLGRKEFEPAK